MSLITLNTIIHAPAERCFLLSLSVDLHQKSLEHTHERAIDGVRSGIMKAGEQVTWEARHFGILFRLSTRISKYQPYQYFVSEQEKGPFARLYHQHIFSEREGITTMTDIFEFKAPCGWLGKLTTFLVLEKHMRNSLLKRNETIKRVAESSDWKVFIPLSDNP